MTSPSGPAPNAPRAAASRATRVAAADLAASRPAPRHLQSRDEAAFRLPSGARSYVASFTKGLPHTPLGLLADPAHFAAFVRAIDSGDARDIAALPLGPPAGEQFGSAFSRAVDAQTRGWESMSAGNAFDLEGADAQAVTMPPAPALHSAELAGEMSELYWMALLRDVPFTAFDSDPLPAAAVASLAPMPAFADRPVTTASLFRGFLPGDAVGPYLSQFLFAGTTLVPSAGFARYGAARFDHRVRLATPRKDYMTTFPAFLDVQNAADMRGTETYLPDPAGSGDEAVRFITTPRDLASYVHIDPLYQAYHVACLILLAINAPFDAGLPFTLPDNIDNQTAFATFGGPHILTLVAEVATRALKAARFQKFNVHRRPRPEALAGLVHAFVKNPTNEALYPLRPLFDALDPDLVSRVKAENQRQNEDIVDADGAAPRTDDFQPGESLETLLLPMAFPEGSPMHPSYGAGHATVAGACVTVLKAFFDHGYQLPFAFVPADDGSRLDTVELDAPLTVEGELNKLCSNISIGRNWAGVHYYTDYSESVRLGEEIAITLLEEQKLTFRENFSMSVPLFDGGVYRI